MLQYNIRGISEKFILTGTVSMSESFSKLNIRFVERWRNLDRLEMPSRRSGVQYSMSLGETSRP
jgi:hypothetical protein